MHVWSSIYEKTKDEARAFKGANAILKRRFKSKKSLEQNSREDNINMLIDSFLGNLN